MPNETTEPDGADTPEQKAYRRGKSVGYWAIKSCPFCGGPGRLVLHPPTGGDWFVNCDRCDYSLRSDATKEEAVRRWNTRL